MNEQEWYEAVAQLSRHKELGKKLPKALYLHRSALSETAPDFFSWIHQQATNSGIPEQHWNIVRLHKDCFKVTLLYYPDFYDEAYPSLNFSYGLDFASEKIKPTDFTSSTNPPILHRKEHMILPSDPNHADFCEITREGEAAGLYENTRIIGFRNSWETLIKDKGYELLDGRLFRRAAIGLAEPQAKHKVDRHKTALSRDSLSSPMKTLANNGYLKGQYTVFDYGCGHGDDLSELQAHGITANGWDPNWRPECEKTEGDLVNLGYVINVIEDLEERVDAVLGAWRLTGKLLVVSAMIASEQHIRKFKPFKDGVLTSRNTFQKYFSQTELQIFIEQILDEEPIPVAPGIFYIFKDKDEEQLYLANKQRRRPQWKQLVHKSRPTSNKKRLLEENRQLLENFWQRCLELGRLPNADEFEESKLLAEQIGSPKQAFNLLKGEADIQALDQAAKERTEDLLVYFALQQFNKKRIYKHMPDPLKRDIKAFFGDYKTAVAEARELLFSLAEPNLIDQMCELAHQQLPASILNSSHSLIIHSRFINDLPPPLRIYAGCATQLFSETDGVDLVKIHIRSGKLTLMTYEGFATQPIPMLRERVKINLRQRTVDFFDYGYGDYDPQPLYWKSRLIDASFPDYDKQQSFDKRLSGLNIPELAEGHGPSLENLTALLRINHGLTIKGYRFFKAQSAIAPS
ncbi:DNA phosphorothioation-associated putative methyltransferase [Endozoicomonas atrinae]|uniref:DNA phosphorothioation-associated putative methyltransferase n=1 Tax=Endozoicomonas atrinae TaxID=1333660 RepID=UPI000826792D|nr:DNA phosphorothioation-associated putative methyltransferase [Endozoicomonas atrinae]